MGAFLGLHTVPHGADVNTLHRWTIRDQPNETTVLEFWFDRSTEWLTCRNRGSARFGPQRRCYLFSFPEKGEVWIVCGPSYDAWTLVVRAVDATTTLQWSLPRMSHVSLARKQRSEETVIPTWATANVRLLGRLLFSWGDDLQEAGACQGVLEINTHDRLG